jgi:hypothetical protein
MLRIGNVRWRGKCPRHPRFDPYIDGRAGITGACEKCTALADIYNHHVQMLALMRGFAPAQRAKRKVDRIAELQSNLFGEM